MSRWSITKPVSLAASGGLPPLRRCSAAAVLLSLAAVLSSAPLAAAQAEPAAATQPAQPSSQAPSEAPVQPSAEAAPGPGEPESGPDLTLGFHSGDFEYSPGEGEEFTPAMEDEIESVRRGMFELKFFEGPIGEYVKWADQLERDTGLRLHMAYTTLLQQASGGPGDRTRFSGDLDIMSSWTLLGRGTKDRGVLVATGEYRHQIGWENANALRDDLGTLQRTTGGFDDRGWVVRDLFWIQHLFDDHLRIIAGRSDVSDIVGSHRLQGINGSFSNRAFSADSTTAYPGGHVMSASASVRPVDWLFFTAGGANGYGRSTINDIQFLDEGKFFTFGEFGLTPNIDGLGRGRYSVLLWHMDERDLIDRPNDNGLTVVLEQDLTDRVHVFARYGWADKGVLTGIESSAQCGLGYRGLLGSPDNLTAAAFGYSDPTNDGREEKVVEVFHRFQVSQHVQFSVGVQGIFDPSNAPDDDALAVLTFRLRIAF